MLSKALARIDRLHACGGSSSPPTCCPPTSPACRCSTRTPASSSSGPAASSPTSWSATRSTAPRRRPSPRCSSAWRSGRSPSTARRYQLESPFIVIATQNPIEMEGTYALPEAQRDRFMARVSMGYPVEAAEIAMLDSHTTHQPARRPRAGHRRGRDPQADRASSARSRLRGGPALRGRDRRRRPGAPPTSGWAPRPAPRSTWSAPPRHPPRSRARLRAPRRRARRWRPPVLAPPPAAHGRGLR